MVNSITIVPIVLSGGSGTRLWPMSKPERPKQFLSLTAEETMLQLTVGRINGCAAATIGRPVLVANVAHANIIAEQIAAAGIDDHLVILEPLGRNTAPAIALAALEARSDDALLVMPSDQTITDIAAFHEAIAKALPLVNEGWLVTFGITPDAPETGYGYIQMGERCADGVHRVSQFVEKPDAERAAAMLAQGDYAWNAGIFLFRADAYLAALERHQPAMLTAAAAALEGAERAGKRVTPDPQAFAASPCKSIDYAIMENESLVACVPVDMGWSDIGSWDALHAISTQDNDGNVVRGDALPIRTSNCLIHTDGPRVTLVDLDDLIVVVSQGEVMILRRGDSQKVREVTEAIRATQLPQAAQ